MISVNGWFIYIFTGTPYIQLANIEIDNPQCPTSDDDLFDVSSSAIHQKLKNVTEALLFDGTNATCLAPFGEGHWFLWLQFVVTVPVNSTKYFVVRLVVKELHCHLTSTVVMANRPGSNASGGKFVECEFMENSSDSSSDPMVCSYACPLNEMSGHRNKRGLTLRFERFPFQFDNNTNGKICSISVEFPSEINYNIAKN